MIKLFKKTADALLLKIYLFYFNNFLFTYNAINNFTVKEIKWDNSQD